jgi:uncharacterized protein (DUF2235 family)
MPASKNIAVFCDGTWQQIDQVIPTNVSLLARCVEPFDANGIPQVVRYDSGVGVGSGTLAGQTKFFGGVFGQGLEQKIMEAYEFLCLNYVPGDNIYIFGFSRGAYTARSLAGLLNLVWILKRDHVDKAAAAQEIYHDPNRKAPGKGQSLVSGYAQEFKKQYCHLGPAEIKYLGVWDTVGELGIPATLPLATQIDAKYRFLDTNLSPLTKAARHAVAIDEQRDAYKPTLWNNIDALNEAIGDDKKLYADRSYQQRWFPGHHSGVGGGQADAGLSLSALRWIAEGAVGQGLVLNAPTLQAYHDTENPTAPFVVDPPSLDNFIVNHVGGISNRLPGPALIDEVSEAAIIRWRRMKPPYRPMTLNRVASVMDKAASV